MLRYHFRHKILREALLDFSNKHHSRHLYLYFYPVSLSEIVYWFIFTCPLVFPQDLKSECKRNNKEHWIVFIANFMVETGSFADSTLSVRFDEKKWYSRDFWKLKILLGFWSLISWHFDSCKARVSRSKLLVRRSVYR